eukprot:403357053
METKELQSSDSPNIQDILQKLASQANQQLSNDIYAKLDMGNGLECEELKDISSSDAQFFKVQVNDQAYFVKKIPCCDIVLKKILTQYEIQQKFGCEMIAQISTNFYHNNHIHLVFEYTEYGDLFTYSQNHRISDYEMRLILQQIFTLLSVMHLSSYYHNDLKASNYLIVQTYPYIKIQLSDFETLSTVEQSESQKLTVEHLYKQEIGKDIFIKSQQDVKNIIESIQNICKSQRKKYEVQQEQRVERIQEEIKQDQYESSDNDGQPKRKVFSGGGIQRDPSNPLKFPNGDTYHRDLYELIQNVLGLHNDQFQCAFQVLTDKYLLDYQNVEGFLQNIIYQQINHEIIEKLKMYKEYLSLTNPTETKEEFNDQSDLQSRRLQLMMLVQQASDLIVSDDETLEQKPGPRRIMIGGGLKNKDIGDDSDKDENQEQDE